MAPLVVAPKPAAAGAAAPAAAAAAVPVAYFAWHAKMWLWSTSEARMLRNCVLELCARAGANSEEQNLWCLTHPLVPSAPSGGVMQGERAQPALSTVNAASPRSGKESHHGRAAEWACTGFAASCTAGASHLDKMAAGQCAYALVTMLVILPWP